MAEPLLRLYGPDELGPDGYPIMWHRGEYPVPLMGTETDAPPDPGVKEIIREFAGYRCERCGHPYPPGIAEQYPGGEWTPCDERCTHGGPWGWHRADGTIEPVLAQDTPEALAVVGWLIETGRIERHASEEAVILAKYRILTTHHLNGVKWDCRWWNLAALCQRCHLTIQGKVHLERPYDRPHTEWFRPHAAGYYASEGIVLFDGAGRVGREPPREWVLEHIDEILAAHATQGTLL